jgi:hypothetical protein
VILVAKHRELANCFADACGEGGRGHHPVSAREMVGQMQIAAPLYKSIQEVIKHSSPRLILFSCPKEYGVDVKSQHDRNIHPSLYSYPIRGAAFTDPCNAVSPSMLILPETLAMKESLKALESVYSYYRIPTPEIIWGPDPVKPGEAFGVFDAAVVNQPEVIQHIALVTPSRESIYGLVSHAYTPETEQVCLAFEQAGIHAIPVFGPKDYGHKSPHDRSGSAAFAEKYGLPYPFSRVGYTLPQIQAAYEEVAARTGNPLVFVKAAITGGGYLINQVQSVEEALTTVRIWDTLGVRVPLYDGEVIGVELQGTIPAIVAICSWQDAHGHITTPLRKDISATKGPAYSVQYFEGIAYAGNGYKVTLPIPEKDIAKTETLIAIYQQRFLASLRQEPDYNPIDTGATDFAVVDLYEMSEQQARLMLKEMWHVAMALDARYVPVGIERNGRRVSDAVPPMAFAELAGLGAGNHPLAAFKIEGIAADPPAIVELLLKEKLMLDPKEGQSGIAPLALIYDHHRHIHYGSALFGAEHEAELFRAKDRVLERLETAGFISRYS